MRKARGIISVGHRKGGEDHVAERRRACQPNEPGFSHTALRRIRASRGPGRPDSCTDSGRAVGTGSLVLLAGGGGELMPKFCQSYGQGTAFDGGHVVDGPVKHALALLTDAFQVPLARGGQSQGDLASTVRARQPFEEASGL